MSRRIEIELTSARADGTWTWRVAGARQPKGVVEGDLLPPGIKVGDVVRAEAEFELEGTVITAVLASPQKRAEPERLQLLGDARPFEGVTTSLVPKGSRPRRDRDDRGPRPEGAGSREAAGPRRSEGGPRRPDGAAARRSEGGPRRPEGGPSRSDRPPARPRTGPDRRPIGSGQSPTDESRRTGTAGHRPDQGGRGRERAAQSGPARPKRLNPGSVHRNAVLDSLAPEERALAEQLLQGGIPAVRRALQEQNTHARAEGRPEVKADALVALAEELLPRLKGAEWRDRAEAAAKEGDELSLRDLRSVVAGADAVARDDESRILAKSLREALDRRETAERESWLAEIGTHLDEGRVARALRLAGRPPDPRVRFPQDVLTRLAQAASDALSPETPPDQWAQVLGAVLESPVRRSVKPVGLPPEPGEALLLATRQASGRIPALAALLGLGMPPPPGPPRPGGRPAPRPARSFSPSRPTMRPRPAGIDARPAAPAAAPPAADSSAAAVSAPPDPATALQPADPAPAPPAPPAAVEPPAPPAPPAAVEPPAPPASVEPPAVAERAVDPTAPANEGTGPPETAAVVDLAADDGSRADDEAATADVAGSALPEH